MHATVQNHHGNRPSSSHHHTAGIKNVDGTEPPFFLLLLDSGHEKAFPHAVLYLDAVEEALCFGWIDSTRKKTASGFLAQRLSPRSRKSKWSELNKERVRRLNRLGLMTPHGKKCLPEMDPAAFQIDPVILERLQEDPCTYANFLAFPRLYRHVRLDTIQIKKNQPELFHSRLEKFLKNTRENRMYGEWNDGGRLLEE